jgi:virginiamycin B lyase
MLISILAAFAATTTHATDLVEVQIEEWLVPYPESRPRDPDVAPDGKVWFVGQRTDYIAWLDPATGEFGRFPLPDGAGPHNLIVADDGFIWYAGNRDAHIGRMDPANGEIERIDMPTRSARDPHTLVFNADGDIWFTLQGANKVGFLDTETHNVHIIDVPTPRARPYGIVVDAGGRPWLNLLGTNKLATVDPGTLELTEIELPREDARTRRIALAHGAIWYVDYAEGHLGRYAPDTGEVTEWRMPGGAGSRPYAMATDARGRLWAFETGEDPNRLVGFDPATGEFFATGEVPSGGGTVRHMVYDLETNSLWFGTDTNHIGRATLP